jgi:putative nucleotidyltransferase with HDIG domain
VLCDLDGFKAYNDTFGHPAGDALLARLGAALRRAADAAGGRAYRIGGDEFCALLPAGAAVEPMVAALTERGDGFAIGASCGVVALPAETADPDRALLLADRRLYADKHSRRDPAGRQSSAVLLRAVKERDPGLDGHAAAVGALAEATARVLGMAEADVEVVRHAGELHDVGKIAIPDELLDKPGPLDDGEWAFMRRHPVIGERIVAAAPALAAVAPLVRSSHERWDGTGYPDRVRGAAVPLGARIVAVSEAFDAMTTEQPYRAAVAPGAALAELERCAGTQFDPDVVAAFAAAYGLSRCPVANRREDHATAAAASAPVTPSASQMLTSPSPRNPNRTACTR